MVGVVTFGGNDVVGAVGPDVVDEGLIAHEDVVYAGGPASLTVPPLRQMFHCQSLPWKGHSRSSLYRSNITSGLFYSVGP